MVVKDVELDVKMQEVQKLKVIGKVAYLSNLLKSYDISASSEVDLVLLRKSVSVVAEIIDLMESSNFLRYADNVDVAHLHFSTESAVLYGFNNIMFKLLHETPLRNLHSVESWEKAPEKEKFTTNKFDYEIIYEDLTYYLGDASDGEYSIKVKLLDLGYDFNTLLDLNCYLVLSQHKHTKKEEIVIYQDMIDSFSYAETHNAVGFADMEDSNESDFAYIGLIPSMMSTLTSLNNVMRGLVLKELGEIRRPYASNKAIDGKLSRLLHKFDKQLLELSVLAKGVSISKDEKEWFGRLFLRHLNLFASDTKEIPSSYVYRYKLETLFFGTYTRISDKLELLQDFFKSVNVQSNEPKPPTKKSFDRTFSFLEAVLETHAILITLNQEDNLTKLLEHSLFSFLTDNKHLLTKRLSDDTFESFVYHTFKNVLEKQ